MKHFRTTERYRLEMADSRIAHAELRIGDTPVLLSVFANDVDAVFSAMVAGGATELFAANDYFHGDRSGR